MKKMRNIFMTICIIMLLIGLCLVFNPYMSANIICIALGIALLISGVIKIYFYFKHDIYGYILNYYGLHLGVLDMIIGMIILLHTNRIMTLIPIFIGMVIILESTYKLHISFDLKNSGSAYWKYMLFTFILSIIFAFLLILNPFESSIALMILVGISLIADSLQNIIAIVYLYKYYEYLLPIDEEYHEIKR